jgi:CRP/FNR family cyclic AMP-dependent transcriptional regulator
VSAASDVRTLLAAHPFTDGCSAAELESLARGARVVDLAPWELLFHEGRPATHAYLVVAGQIGLELHVPNGGSVVVATVGPGELLGWSWLLPPHTWRFDARARSAARLVALDAGEVRSTCAADPALDRLVTHRMLETLAARLEATRHQLIDVYGRGVT